MITEHINPYLQSVKSNEPSAHDRILELTDMHLKHIAVNKEDKAFKDESSKIKSVLDHYIQATDRDNPMRDRFQILPEMNGTLASNT